jgi:integrase
MTNGPGTVPNQKRKSPRYWIEKNGRLYARLQYKDEDGRARERYQPISDKRTARSVVERMRRDLEQHGHEIFEAARLTFNDLADRYEATELVQAMFQNGVKVRGRKSVGSIRSALKPGVQHFGRRAISSIKAADLQSFKNVRLNTPVEIEIKQRTELVDAMTGRKKVVITRVTRQRQRKIATVNRELAAMRAVLNFAVANDWLVVSPFAKAKSLISAASEVQRDRVLSFDEESRLLAACIGNRAHLKALVICALDTAMRRGEIFKMRWTEVSFASGEILIPQSNTKTQETRRVAMTARLRSELERLWRMSPRDPSGRVFGITNNIKRSWASACSDANVVDFRFHDCRHTATTRMIASGSPHTEVMKITGHSQMKTFLRYLNITPETTNRVASRLDDYVRTRQTDPAQPIVSNDDSR